MEAYNFGLKGNRVATNNNSDDDDDDGYMKTYKLGPKGNRVVTVNERDDEHFVTVIEKDSYTKRFHLPPKR